MSGIKKLVITFIIIIQTPVLFCMRPRGSSTRPPNPLHGMAATVAPVQSTEHKPRAWGPTMEYPTDEQPAPSPSDKPLSTTVGPKLQHDTSFEPKQEDFLELEAIDRALLERRLNPSPEISNPVGVNDHIIINPFEMQAITPLGLAAFWGWDDIIDKLCAQGAQINEPMPTNTFSDLEGFTPLHIAVMFNRIRATRALIKRQADINAKINSTTAYNGLTPLDLAHRGGSQLNEMATLLTLYGAHESSPVREGSPSQQTLLLTQYRTQNKMQQDPMSFDIEGQTPLTNAIRTGNVALVQKLIAQGSNPDTPIAALEHNRNAYAGFSPLCLAAFSGNSAIVETLLQHGANPNYVIKNNPKGWNSFSPLHIAITRHKPEIVIRLIKHHAEINKAMSPDKGYKFTPLGVAACMGYYDIIKILCSAGATVDYTIDGFTPLHYAILQKHYKAASTLINNGATIDAIINNPSSELHNFNTVCLVVRNSDSKSLAILIKLIELGANLQHVINSATKYNGYTPLTLAIYTGNLQAIKYLVGAGIDTHKEKFIAKALSHLKQTAPQAAYNTIESYIAKARLSQQLLDMSQEFNKLFIKLCNEQKQLKEVDIGIIAPDQLANITGILKTIQDLLIMGADPNIKNRKGWTPLLFAIARTNIEQGTLSDELVNLLLAQGADPSTVSYNGISPLSLATTYNNIRVVKMLLEAGADPQPDLGQQPLEIAKAQKHTDIEKLLEKAIKEKTKKPSRVSRVLSTLSKTLKR